jgi:hypothetical protein
VGGSVCGWLGGWEGRVLAGLQIAVRNKNATEEDHLEQILAVSCVTAAPFITTWGVGCLR